MKKLICVLSILIVFIIGINVVNAEGYKCTYDYNYDSGYWNWVNSNLDLTFTINVDTKTISYNNNIFTGVKLIFLDEYIDSKYTEEYIVDSLNGGCPSKIIAGAINGDSSNGVVISFEEANFYRLERIQGIPLVNKSRYNLPHSYTTQQNGVDTYGFMYVYEEDLMIATYNESKSTRKRVETNFECDYVNKTFEDVLEKYHCKSKASNCSVSELQQYNDSKELLKNFCYSVFESGNIGLNSCINPCLELNDRIANIEDGGSNSNECGFSNNLAAWIRNIVNWARFLIPVAVIILSILDFIKAMAGDKDDDMKKAQGKFVKRLIAAALVFIIPSIIMFILDKMGFADYANGCGIIDL